MVAIYQPGETILVGGGIGLRHGPRLAGGGAWVEGVSGLSFTTTSTSAAWTPNTVTKTGGALTWRVYSAAGVLLLEEIANKPTFNLSALAGTKTLHVTSPDGWAGLTALNFTAPTGDIASLNLAVATGLTSLTLNSLTGLSWTVGAAAPMPTGLTSLDLRYGGAGIVWAVGAAAPMPTGLTSLNMIGLTGITWTVGAAAPMPTGLTSINFNGTPGNLAGITWTVGASAPMPAGLTSMALATWPGLTWTVGASAPMPTGLTSLNMYNLAGLIWTVGVDAPMPTGLLTLVLVTLANLTAISTWAINTLRTVQYENNLTQAQVDAVVAAIYANRASYTYATPSLDIAGTGNAAPSGTYADEDPPSTGKGYIYELVVDPETEGFNKWVVTYTA